MKLTSPADYCKKIYLRRLDFKLQKILAKKGSPFNKVREQQKRNAYAVLTGMYLNECISDTRTYIIVATYM